MKQSCSFSGCAISYSGSDFVNFINGPSQSWLTRVDYIVTLNN